MYALYTFKLYYVNLLKHSVYITKNYIILYLMQFFVFDNLSYYNNILNTSTAGHWVFEINNTKPHIVYYEKFRMPLSTLRRPCSIGDEFENIKWARVGIWNFHVIEINPLGISTPYVSHRYFQVFNNSILIKMIIWFSIVVFIMRHYY